MIDEADISMRVRRRCHVVQDKLKPDKESRCEMSR